MMGWMAPLRHLGARVLVGSSSSTRVSSLRVLAHYMQHLDSDHIHKYAAELCRMAVFGTLNPLTPARLQA